MRDNFYVYQSGSLGETIELIEKLKTQMKNGDYGVWNADTNTKKSYLDVIKVEKKANMTSEMCYLAQLKQIPRVSANMAKTICAKYSSMAVLFDAYREIDNLKSENLSDLDRLKAKKVMLAGLKVGDRKIGKKTSENIYNFLF